MSLMYEFHRRLELGTKCLDMAVDERSIVCGLEDGRVDVYSRSIGDYGDYGGNEDGEDDDHGGRGDGDDDVLEDERVGIYSRSFFC